MPRYENQEITLGNCFLGMLKWKQETGNLTK